MNNNNEKQSNFANSISAIVNKYMIAIFFATIIFVLFAIFYFLLIRPQQKKAKEHKAMIENLKKGNRVVTSGGIFGTIISLDDTTLGLEIAEKVKIKVARSNIAGLVSDNDTQAKSNEKN